ncbi:hypothetical protein AcV7_007610 [Taiwanofungus camphoratus]|nr:hypothetical protein AcV7_007610 [Antrodia cinnamomea]
MTSPFGWDGTFVSDWESIQSTCNFAANNTIPASLLFNASNPLAANGTTSNVTAMPTLPPASSANCTFGSYTVQSGDTCDSIAAAKSLSYDQLISINGLDINCTMLPPAGSTICLSGACSLYTVQTNDTCVEIAADHNVTWSQLLSWNPQINSYCNNLILEVGKGICVGPPGGGYTPSATVTFVTGSPTAIAIPTAPIAPGADRSQCGQWYVAVPGDTCPEIITVFQLTNETFYELNPLVNADCSNLLAGFSYCVAVYGNLTTTTEFVAPTSTGAAMIQYLSGYFPVGTGYLTDAVNLTSVSVALPPTTPGSPIPTPTPTVAPGSLNSSSCFSYYEVQTGDSCLSIEVVYDITEDELMEWNPEIASNCSNLVPGLSYCVLGPAIITTISVTTTYTWPSNSTATTTGTTTSGNSVPTNVASGTNTTGCTQYYTVQSGDSCSVIEQDYSITLAQFLAWNPEVFANCTNIDVGLAYCVSGPAVSSSPTTTSSTPTASPTAPGTIPTGCTQYYTVVSGDNCGSVDAKFNITLAQFLAWNTGVDSSCDNLELGYQYCVAGPPLSTTTTATPTSSSPAASPTAPGVISGCTEYYTVVSGDYCSEIETKFNITSAEFLAWNTDLNSDCSNLEAGYEYCVAGPSTK